jgi:predicted transcriptional regulator
MSADDYAEKEFDNDIILKLLSAITGGSTSKEQLESLTGISSMQLNRYLEELIKDSLVGYDIHDGTALRITEKGSRFLISYERVVASKAEHGPPEGLLDLK